MPATHESHHVDWLLACTCIFSATLINNSLDYGYVGNNGNREKPSHVVF